jgi:hypothetical protein
LQRFYSEIGDGLLVCVTETKSAWELIDYASRIAHIMDASTVPPRGTAASDR